MSLLASAVRWMPRDISLASLSALSTLDRAGPPRITDLARLEGVAQPSMTVLAGTMERGGFAARRRDPSDRRVVLIGLTAAGTEAAALLAALPACAT